MQYSERIKHGLWVAFSSLFFILQNNTLKAHQQNVSLPAELSLFLDWILTLYIYLV